MRKIKTLKKNYEFKNVINKGNFFVGRQIIVYIQKNNKNENYLGIAVCTKVGKAVTRNRLKRLIRENYYIKKDSIKKGYNIVFIWNKKVDPDTADFHIINEDMLNILKKAGLIEE